MRRFSTTGLALGVVLAMSCLGTGTAVAAPKTLSLYYPESGAPVPTGEAVELPSTAVKFEADGREGSCVDSLGPFASTLATNQQKTDLLTINSGSGSRCSYGTKYSITAEPRGFPWTLSLGANGKASVSGAIVFEVTVETFIDKRVTCTYEAKKLSGTETLNGGLTVALAGNLKHQAGEKSPCNGTMVISTWEIAPAGGEGAIDDLVE